MYMKYGNMVVVDRVDAEQLFAAVGCVNVGKWDSDVLVLRLKRLAMFCDADLHVGSFQPLIDAILGLGAGGSIVLRNTTKPQAEPLSAMDIYYARMEGRHSKSSNGRGVQRVRGATFSFDKCGIPVGSTLVWKRDPSITCTVVGDPWVVDFGDDVMESFTNRTRKLLGVKESTYLSPMHYWMYDGKLLRCYYKKFQNAGRPRKNAKHKKLDREKFAP